MGTVGAATVKKCASVARIASWCVIMCGAVSGAAAAADIVHLRNGDILEGKIIEETDRHVMLEVNRGSVWIPRSDVAMIRRDQAPTPLSLARLRQLAEDLKRASEAPPETDAAPTAAGEGKAKAVDSKRLRAIREAVSDLSSADAKEREEARERIRGFGRDAIPALTSALSHNSTFVRTTAAQMLGTYNARQSVKALLTALRGAVPDKKKVRPWQRGFVRALNTSLRRITSQSFDVRERSVNQDAVVAKFVTWWDGTAEPGGEDSKGVGACSVWDMPQVGEAEVDEEDPERAKKLWKMRRVSSSKYRYSPPKSFGGGGGGG